MPLPAIIAGGAALLGGAAGAIPKKSSQTSTVDAGDPTQAEQYGQNLQNQSVKDLEGYVAQGPGASDVGAATDSSRSLAAMLGQYSRGGFNPNQDDITRSNGLASQLFQGQQTALNQSFTTQRQNYNQQAALMGRDPNDPVLANKLSQLQTNQQQQLSANQGSFATQLAMNSPMQRLQYAQQQNQVLGGLASQALANKQALAGLGQGIMTNERNFRLATASRSQDTTSGGGLGGFLTGAIAGAGTGFGIAGGKGFQSMFGSDSSAVPFPTASQQAPFSGAPLQNGAQNFGGGTGYGFQFGN